MDLDHRYRESLATLLAPGEGVAAAPTTGAWRSGAAHPVGLTGGAAHLARKKGVAGRLIDVAGVSIDDVRLHDELMAVTDRRLVFVAEPRLSRRPRARQITGEYPVDAVSLSWADASVKNVEWRAFCFHLPGGSWWALETELSRPFRSVASDEADLVVEAFGSRSRQFELD